MIDCEHLVEECDGNG